MVLLLRIRRRRRGPIILRVGAEMLWRGTHLGRKRQAAYPCIRWSDGPPLPGLRCPSGVRRAQQESLEARQETLGATEEGGRRRRGSYSTFLSNFMGHARLPRRNRSTPSKP